MTKTLNLEKDKSELNTKIQNLENDKNELNTKNEKN